jgi:outer membrane protein
MMMKTLFVCLMLVAVGAAPATAQSASPLTLEDAVARALATSHRLAEAQARREGAEAEIRVRHAAKQPTAVLSGGYTRTNHVDEFAVPQPGGALRILYPDVPNNYVTRASFQWPIYTGGRLDALERAAAAEAEASAADIEVARADLRLEVVRVYWALATATESVRVLDEAVARADAHLRDVRARFDTGLIPPNEVSSVEAQRSRQELQRIEARNLRSSILEDLRRLTGITADILPADRLAARDPGPAASEVGTPPVESPTRAETVALTARVSAAEERQAAAAAARLPTISFTGAADYARPNARIFPRVDDWNTSWELGVSVSWTLWDGRRVAAESAQAAAAASAVRARLAELDSVIATEVRQRQLDLDSARAAIPAATDAVRSATDARRVVAERFNVGVATSTEVLDAELALLQAELDRTRALANIRLAEARLARALGR